MSSTVVISPSYTADGTKQEQKYAIGRQSAPREGVSEDDFVAGLDSMLGHFRRAHDAVVVNAQNVSPHAAGLIEQVQLESRKLSGASVERFADRSAR